MNLSTRAIARHPSHWRPLSTSVETFGSSPSRQRPPATSKTHTRWQGQETPRDIHPRMIFVRPWDGIKSMAHAFAIIREIERQFGKVQEFVVPRDSDVLTKYSPYIHAIFARAEDANAISTEGRIIQVKAPRVDVMREGGVGLDDLEVYLNPEPVDMGNSESTGEGGGEKKEESEWGPPEEAHVMDVKLERTGLRDMPTVLDSQFRFIGRIGPPHLRDPMRAQQLAKAIHAFGGFVDVSDEEQGEIKRTRTRMQVVVDRWSRMVRHQPEAPEHVPVSVPVQESEAGEEVESISTSEGTEWIPFNQADPTSPPRPPSPIISPASPSPLPPSTPSLPPNLPQSTAPKPPPPPPPPPPKSKPTPAAPPAPTGPRLSKKERMLLAARSAGTIAAERSNDRENGIPSVDTHSTDALAHDVGEGADAEKKFHAELVRSDDAAALGQQNKAAAQKWWSFLNRSKD